MEPIRSKITRQGQMTVPAAIRRRLGLAPGSTVEWREAGGEIIVARAATVTSHEIHQELFADTPESKTLDEMNAGIRERMQRKYAGG